MFRLPHSSYMKTVLSVLLSALLLSSSVLAENRGLKYQDVPSEEWYYESVEYVSRQGIMVGANDLNFLPDSTTTRGMVVTILYSLEGKPVVTASSFLDVPASRYYAKPVAWAARNGIVSGYSKEEFRPDADITRQQFLAILYQYAQVKELPLTGSVSLDAYRDRNEVSSYAVQAFSWAVGNGIISGMPGQLLAPRAKTTRAQISMMLMRFCTRYQIEPVPAEPSDESVVFISREGRINGAPANSLIGAEEAKDAGYSMIRVSVRRTSDGVWVLFHDDSILELARNPDGSVLEEDVRISDSDLEALLPYDYGIAYGEEYRGSELLTLDDFLAWAGENEMEILLEMKIPLDEELASDLAEHIREYHFEDSVWFSAYEISTLQNLQALLPQADLAYIDHFREEALQTILTSGLISEDHAIRLDCYYTDTFDDDLIGQFQEHRVAIKVGSIYSVSQLYSFLEKDIQYIEVANIVRPYQYIN